MPAVFLNPLVAAVQLDNKWLVEHLPERLLRMGPAGVAWWQWIALPILVVVALAIGRLLSALTRLVLGRLAARTKATWDDVLVARIGGPLTCGWAIVVMEALLPVVGLTGEVGTRLHRLLGTGLLIVFFWAVLRVVDVLGSAILASEWARLHHTSRALVPLGSRVAKVLLFVIAVIAVISDFGYPVGSMIAGLGLGGLAFALAAQKTVENLFGAFSLGVDQPIREGDYVKIDDVVSGTVEQIGLRSTRIRTLDRTVVSIPNGKVAEMRLDTYAVRDRIRLATTIGLVYETTAEQMRQILAGFERILRQHPKIWPDGVSVNFVNFGASSLDVAVNAWFKTTDWNDFQNLRQEVFLAFMDVVEKAGSGFAFPTQTVHLVQDPPPKA